MKEALTTILEHATDTLAANGSLPSRPNLTPQVDHARDPSHGDFATNLAMVLAKQAGKPPRQLADDILAALPDND